MLFIWCLLALLVSFSSSYRILPIASIKSKRYASTEKSQFANKEGRIGNKNPKDYRNKKWNNPDEFFAYVETVLIENKPATSFANALWQFAPELERTGVSIERLFEQIQKSLEVRISSLIFSSFPLGQVVNLIND